MHLKWTDYEIWWKGADDHWRMAKKYDRPDRALEYVRRFHQEYPDVHVCVFKRWQIRHMMWEMRSDNPATVFPEVTKLEQLELEDGEHRIQNCQTTGETQRDAGPDADRPDRKGRGRNAARSGRCEAVDQGEHKR